MVANHVGTLAGKTRACLPVGRRSAPRPKIAAFARLLAANAETQRCPHSQQDLRVIARRKTVRKVRRHHHGCSLPDFGLPWLFSSSVISSDLTRSMLLLSFKLRRSDGSSELLANKGADSTCSTNAREMWPRCFEQKPASQKCGARLGDAFLIPQSL